MREWYLAVASFLFCEAACGHASRPDAVSIRSAGTSGPAPTTVALPAIARTPLQLVCAGETCGGSGAVVRTWLRSDGAVARYEIVDSPRCSHIAGIFYDATGHEDIVLPMPFYPPGTPEQQGTIRAMHDGQLVGLRPGATTICP